VLLAHQTNERLIFVRRLIRIGSHRMIVEFFIDIGGGVDGGRVVGGKQRFRRQVRWNPATHDPRFSVTHI